MNRISSILASVTPKPDGDSVDRLNYCFTTVALAVASAFIAGWSFVGNPIQCWFPAYFKGWWMEYAHDYCYVQNTYFIPMYEKVDMNQDWNFGQLMMPIPVNDTVRERNTIGYYQWVPFILAAAAFMFWAPIVIWRMLYESAGFKMDAMMDQSSYGSNMDEKIRKSNMNTIASFLVQEHSFSLYPAGSSLRRISTGNYITWAYLFVKLLFLGNAILQFVALKGLLGVDSYNWGWDVAWDFFNGIEWPDTGNFPRITLCDFQVRELGNLHHHTVQCVLMINMFNEKIFIVYWFWLAFIIAINLTSLLNWVYSVLFARSGEAMVNNYIHRLDQAVARSMQKKDLLKEFVTKKLRRDGVFLVRLIAINHGDMVASELLKVLWDDFVQTRGERPPPYNEPLLLKNSKLAEEEL